MSEYDYVIGVLMAEIGNLSPFRREFEIKGFNDSSPHRKIAKLESAIKRLKGEG